jgi:glycosyltransferase involved in cell wall biosynthesis
MKISYAITVCNEIEEIKRLLSFLLQHKREEDEIVVLMDSKGPDEIWEYLKSIGKDSILLHKDKFNNDFSEWKNHLNSLCSGNYIFNIDADEIPSETLVKNLPQILELNPDVIAYAVPRVNTVEGLTQDHIQKWGWNVNENGWVNYPDYQARVCKNIPQFKWVGKVHEKILGDDGFNANVSFLPTGYDLELIHPKTIERQERQNNYYDTI